ncbi:hypothetical protein [Cognatilysobacter segetis]|uniref:hypothetical protein n=1 Tax=Cognatilysobacter segetis TaxID=2492394 RepID=UPI00105C3668|nr:hypothetical protein [Lysobacter segetis]
MNPVFHSRHRYLPQAGEEVVRVRILSSKGWYAAGEIALPDAFIYADDDLALIVSKGYSWNHYIEDASFDEFDWPYPVELRLMGSFIFCEDYRDSRVLFYPRSDPTLTLVPQTVDLADPRSRQAVVELVKDIGSWPVPDLLLDGMRKSIASENYSTFDGSHLDTARIAATWNLIEPTNFVLLRGISAILKCDMLGRHREFSAEALMSLYIAMECSFQLVLEALKARGNPNPSASDAAQWMYEVFESPFGEDPPNEGYKYLHDYYESRIATFHPRSRFGDLPFVPHFQDDLIDLRARLSSVFGYMLHGSHTDEFVEAVETFKRSASRRAEEKP